MNDEDHKAMNNFVKVQRLPYQHTARRGPFSYDEQTEYL
jgi:hypothetical protein